MTIKSKILERWFQKAYILIFTLFMACMLFVLFTAYVKRGPHHFFTVKQEASK